MLDLYQPGHSLLHRLAPGLKVLALVVVGTGLFVFDLGMVSLAALLAALLLYRVAGFDQRMVWRQIRPVLWLLGLLVLAQGLFNSWSFGVFLAVRLTALLLLAGLVTLTTRSSDMIAALERALSGLRRFGIRPARIGLAIALALRFIPVLAQVTQEVRDAQKARGLERSVVATAIPVAVRTMKMAGHIAEAIDARGFDP